MKSRVAIGSALVAVALAAGALAGIVPASGGGGGTGIVNVNFAAPTFTPVVSSTHNDGDQVCGAFVASQPPDENRGDLNAKLGSFLTNVRLPDGVEVRRLTLFANDFSDQNAHVYLVRKRIENGLDPQFAGYQVMAKTNTSGAENGVMRKFTDDSVVGATIDNDRFYYFLELVVCDAIEPFAVQVGYR